jgi:hypothetical protein
MLSCTPLGLGPFGVSKGFSLDFLDLDFSSFNLCDQFSGFVNRIEKKCYSRNKYATVNISIAHYNAQEGSNNCGPVGPEFAVLR